MAKEWAAGFYNSPPWKRTRRAYKRSVHGLCECCGERNVIRPGTIVHHHKVWLTPVNIGDPHITLGWWNLKLVCDECHNIIHHRGPVTREGFAFDANGDLIATDPPPIRAGQTGYGTPVGRS